MTDQAVFEEKQYLGNNRSSNLARTGLALFCFLAYYWSENPKPVKVAVIKIGSYPVEDIPNSGALFFLMGMVILVVSAILEFVLHIRTVVYPRSIVLDGLWTARKVKINLETIAQIEQVPYSKYSLNRAVYNLHRNGVIRFYTGGSSAIRLTDRDGLKYLIGTQKSQEFYRAIKTAKENLLTNQVVGV